MVLYLELISNSKIIYRDAFLNAFQLNYLTCSTTMDFEGILTVILFPFILNWLKSFVVTSSGRTNVLWSCILDDVRIFPVTSFGLKSLKVHGISILLSGLTFTKLKFIVPSVDLDTLKLSKC